MIVNGKKKEITITWKKKHFESMKLDKNNDKKLSLVTHEVVW
jgi:hypothetical protein